MIQSQGSFCKIWVNGVNLGSVCNHTESMRKTMYLWKSATIVCIIRMVSGTNAFLNDLLYTCRCRTPLFNWRTAKDASKKHDLPSTPDSSLQHSWTGYNVIASIESTWNIVKCCTSEYSLHRLKANGIETVTQTLNRGDHIQRAFFNFSKGICDALQYLLGSPSPSAPEQMLFQASHDQFSKSSRHHRSLHTEK